MYNVEEKINNWYKNNKTSEKQTNNYSNVGKVTPVSKNKVNEVTTRDELVKRLEEYGKQFKTIRDNFYLKNTGIQVDTDYNDVKSLLLTDNEIQNKATKSVDDKFTPKYEKLESDKKITENNLKAQDEKISNNFTKGLNEILSNAEKKVSSAKETAIKNGVSRSSILNSQVGEVEKQAKEQSDKLSTETQKLLTENAKKLDDVKINYDSAVKNLDSEKASALENEITSLKNQRQYLIDNALKERSIGGYTGEMVSNSEYLDIVKNLIHDSLDYYYRLDKDTALEELENDHYINVLLGDYKDVIKNYIKAQA